MSSIQDKKRIMSIYLFNAEHEALHNEVQAMNATRSQQDKVSVSEIVRIALASTYGKFRAAFLEGQAVEGAAKLAKKPEPIKPVAKPRTKKKAK